MEITFLGATETVTGSKYLLSLGDQKILVDCGLFQGLKELRLRNWNPFPVDIKTIDCVILTHAHIDHTGYLPLLYKNGFRGKIYCTQGTNDLCEILLPDSAYLQEEEASYANRHGYSRHNPALPLYTLQDAKGVLEQFVPYPFNEEIELNKQCKLTFFPAGHIIGSALVQITCQDKKILFSGDLGRPHDLVMKAPQVIDEVDYLIIESTYGDRVHDKTHPCDVLAEVINRTIKRGGSVIMPSFAVGRAQLLLYYLYLLKKNKRIPDVPVFLDSPMAVSATHIFMRYHHEHRLSDDDIRGMFHVATYANTRDDSKEIDSNQNPKIIISASGMVTGGRVLHHVKTFAPDTRNTILFTGYQAVGTRGARIITGEREVKMLGEIVTINAEIAELGNISAHADSVEALEWLHHFKKAPRKVFITHGEQEAAQAFKKKIEKELGWKCTVPIYLATEKL